jgi:hypothetical protein
MQSIATKVYPISARISRGNENRSQNPVKCITGVIGLILLLASLSVAGSFQFPQESSSFEREALTLKLTQAFAGTPHAAWLRRLEGAAIKTRNTLPVATGHYPNPGRSRPISDYLDKDRKISDLLFEELEKGRVVYDLNWEQYEEVQAELRKRGYDVSREKSYRETMAVLDYDVTYYPHAGELFIQKTGDRTFRVARQKEFLRIFHVNLDPSTAWDEWCVPVSLKWKRDDALDFHDERYEAYLKTAVRKALIAHGLKMEWEQYGYGQKVIGPLQGKLKLISIEIRPNDVIAETDLDGSQPTIILDPSALEQDLFVIINEELNHVLHDKSEKETLATSIVSGARQIGILAYEKSLRNAGAMLLGDAIRSGVIAIMPEDLTEEHVWGTREYYSQREEQNLWLGARLESLLIPLVEKFLQQFDEEHPRLRIDSYSGKERHLFPALATSA